MSVYTSKIDLPSPGASLLDGQISNTDQPSIRAVFPTGPYGDLNSEHAHELERLLMGAQCHVLDFTRDPSRPQLQVTAWFTRPLSHARGSHLHHRRGPRQTIAARHTPDRKR
jgi:hypothetical protein